MLVAIQHYISEHGPWRLLHCYLGLTVKASLAPLDPPVVTVTVRFPGAASTAIETLAVRLVALVTVTVFTVIPAPKLTTVVPSIKCMN